MSSASATRIARAALTQTAREFVLLPFWWYTEGLMRMIDWMRQSVKHASVVLGLGVWVKNLFVPMYGDTALVGRLISFGIRLFVIVTKGTGVFVWMLFVSFLFLVSLLALPTFAILFILHFFGVLFG